MTILASDIKLLQSERMSDAADGGGRMTSAEVVDGVAGSLFPKVSRLDAVYGRVNIRKIYAAVMSALADTYGGAHAIITDPPDNPRISCVLFSTGSHFDTRAEARNRIESYVVAGGVSRMRLYATQIVGQRSLLVYQRAEDALPDVGDTICLSVEAAGYTPAQQYVRIEDVDHEVRTFTDANGDFDRRVIRLALTSPLSQTFVGAEPVRFSADPSPTKLRDTTVADTAKYYGIRPLAVAAAAGDLDLQLDSIYTPIVPGTQRETAISLVQMAGAVQYVQTGPETTVLGVFVQLDTAASTFLPMSALPGSIKIPAVAGWTDKGDGTWTATGRSGTIDYNTGEIRQTAGGSYGASVAVTWTPAREVATQSHTLSTPVTLGTRGLVYTMQLDPMPGAGSLTVDYRALGRWYRLRDDGSGKLVGASPAEGSGQVSFTSGAAVATLGALPDVDSAVIWTWASPLHFTQRAGAAADNPDWGVELHIQLPDFPVRPDSIGIAYSASGQSYTMLDNAAGAFTHSGVANRGVTASVDYARGLIVMRLMSAAASMRPSTSSIVTVTYEQELAAPGQPMITTSTVAVTAPSSWNCGHTNMSPRSVRIVRPMFDWGGFVTLVDDGTGGLVTLYAKFGDVVVSAGQSAGTVDYVTGDITLTDISTTEFKYELGPFRGQGVPQSGQWVSTTRALPPVVADYDVSSKGAAVSYASRTHAVTISSIGYRFDLTRTVGEAVSPGSLWMFFGGTTYSWVPALSIVDRGNGLLYSSMSTTTGAATVVGEIDYESGIAIIRELLSSALQEVRSPVRSCLTVRGNFTVVSADFRTPGSPLRPASLYVQATSADGTQCVGTADQTGVITGQHIRGAVKVQTGVAHVEFGDLVLGEWVPLEVLPATIRFSAVVLSTLALDPSILGLDPVRLPSDGRAPVVRAGDVAVVHHTGSVVYASPVAGGAISAGRGDLAAVEVRDADGKRVPADRYSIDMATGNGTWADPLVLTGYTLPLTFRHRIEDMGMVADAQISGAVSLAAPLLRDYPLGSWLSTALLAGDMGARVEGVFDQAAWTGVWSDSVIGSPATAELNTLQYPIEVANEGAVLERWRAQVKSLSPLTLDIYGEGLGFVGTFAASGTIAPVNPLTGMIYWAIQPGAWGVGNGGWSVGNNVRWKTVSAAYPITVLRTILSGAALTGDAVYIESRGDVD